MIKINIIKNTYIYEQTLMIDGKKSVAETYCYNAFERVEGKLKLRPVEVSMWLRIR